jgi:hypothetical protein
VLFELHARLRVSLITRHSLRPLREGFLASLGRNLRGEKASLRRRQSGLSAVTSRGMVRIFLVIASRRVAQMHTPSLRAIAKQSSRSARKILDCFVASLFAMTARCETVP